MALKYLTPDETASFKDVLNKFSSRDPRNTLLLRLALETGGRPSELLMLSKVDVDFKERCVHIKGLKNSNDRFIPLREETWSLFKDYVAQASGDRLFPISYQRFFKIWELYRPVRKKLHSLRHTFAHGVYERTRDVRLVQKALGHKSLHSTQVYLDKMMPIADMRRIL